MPCNPLTYGGWARKALQPSIEIEARRVARSLEIIFNSFPFCSGENARIVETGYRYFYLTRQHGSAFRSLELILTHLLF